MLFQRRERGIHDAVSAGRRQIAATPSPSATPTVIIGAGHCGLARSHCLAARSVDHVVLERGQVANSGPGRRRRLHRADRPGHLDTVDLVESAGQAVADRLLIHYRLDLAQRGTRWACTQTSVCKIVGGRLATIDLLCSGFREI